MDIYVLPITFLPSDIHAHKEGPDTVEAINVISLWSSVPVRDGRVTAWIVRATKGRARDRGDPQQDDHDQFETVYTPSRNTQRIPNLHSCLCVRNRSTPGHLAAGMQSRDSVA